MGDTDDNPVTRSERRLAGTLGILGTVIRGRRRYLRLPYLACHVASGQAGYLDVTQSVAGAGRLRRPAIVNENRLQTTTSPTKRGEYIFPPAGIRGDTRYDQAHTSRHTSPPVHVVPKLPPSEDTHQQGVQSDNLPGNRGLPPIICHYRLICIRSNR
jgi:hypothetical protein